MSPASVLAAVRQRYDRRVAVAMANQDYGAYADALADYVMGVQGAHSLDIGDVHAALAVVREGLADLRTIAIDHTERLNSIDALLAELLQRYPEPDDAEQQ